MIQDDVRRFVFQIDVAEFAGFVAEDDDVLVCGGKEDAVIGLGRDEVGENGLDQLGPLAGAADGDLVIFVD